MKPYIKPFLYVLLWGWLFCSAIVQSEELTIVDHVDLLSTDAALNLSDLVNQTLEKYPDAALIAAMQQESEALHARGRSWISGAPQLQTYYKDDFAGTGTGAYEFNGSIQVPMWNWGQRDAGLQLAEKATKNTTQQEQAIKLKVAGLIREILWSLKLEGLRYDMAKKELALAERLLETVQRRNELGDLPKSDFLLAKNRALQKRTALIRQEAEVMHARKRYYFLTQIDKIPEQIAEVKSTTTTINEGHPALAAINSRMAKLKAKMEWISAQGSGKTTIAIGGVTERGARTDSAINSIVFAVNIPFGGQAFLAPKVAIANRSYVAVKAAKMHLYRALLARLHEVGHALEVELEQSTLAQQMQANTQERLKMADISFSAGEINLTDFLIIQTQAYRAINNAREIRIRLQRDIAFYNQAVGVMP